MRGYISSDLVAVIPATVPTWALMVEADEVTTSPVVAWGLYEERLADEPAQALRNVRAMITTDDDRLVPAGIPANFAGLVHSLDDVPTVAAARDWAGELRTVDG